MKNLNQKYLGSVTEKQASRLVGKGYDFVRRGSLIQVFGDGETDSLSKKALRGEVWFPPKRDTLQLYLDTKMIIKRLVPTLREDLFEMENPDIELDFVRQIGHGHSLHIQDRFANEMLDIHVAVDAADPDTWVQWRLTHWTEMSREIYEEGSLSYPDKGPWDDEKLQKKAVDAILTPTRKWLKGQR